jgi:hypothetical protein
VVNGSRVLAPMLSAFHFLTHIALSWILANLRPATHRDRWMILAPLTTAGSPYSRARIAACDRGFPFPKLTVSAPGSTINGVWLDADLARGAWAPAHRVVAGVDTTKVRWRIGRGAVEYFQTPWEIGRIREGHR